MPRVLTADELAVMKSGHGWQEYRPDPEDGQEIPFDEYMTEIVWLQGVQLMRDCCGKYSTGSSQPNEWYGVDWRIWDEKPSEELAKNTAWKTDRS